MPRKPKNDVIRFKYFRWVLRRRGQSFFADGRSNVPALGRHTLETNDRRAALQALEQLDMRMAIAHGLADRSLLEHSPDQQLTIEEGRRLYEEHAHRPQVVSGPRESTRKRYRAVLDKFVAFVQDQRIGTWNQVTRKVMNGYATWLDDNGYAPRTEYLELTVLKQVLKFLVQGSHLPASCLFPYPLSKPQGSDTYCWEPEEFTAMVDNCRRHAALHWLGDVIIALGSTGLRIAELASLRWRDIDFDKGVISLTDESHRSRQAAGGRRRTKSGKSRNLPIHEDLFPVLQRLKRHADGLVFHGPKGGRLKPDTVRRILVRDVLTPLAESFPNTRFLEGRLHSFRHFFCSMSAISRVPERVLMDWLGHADSRMVRNYYHLHDQESQRQIRLVKLFVTPDVRTSTVPDENGGASPQRHAASSSTTIQPS